MARRNTVLLGVMVFTLVTGFGLLLWPDSEGGDYRVAHAVVLRPAACGDPAARDSVRVELGDGRTLSALLDGCGNRPGEVLTVEVPDLLSTNNGDHATGTASTADAAATGDAGDAGATTGHATHSNASVESSETTKTAGPVVVRLAGTGVPAGARSAQRLSAVGVVVAGTAGALLAWRLGPILSTGPRSPLARP